VQLESHIIKDNEVNTAKKNLTKDVNATSDKNTTDNATAPPDISARAIPTLPEERPLNANYDKSPTRFVPAI